MLKVTIQELDNAVMLRCSGSIVGQEEAAILCAVAGLDKAGLDKAGLNKQDIFLDLAEVDTIDATGRGLLIGLQAAGFYITLVNPSPRVRQSLEAAQLDTVLEICESEPGRDHAGEVAVSRATQAAPHAGPWGIPRLVTC